MRKDYLLSSENNRIHQLNMVNPGCTIYKLSVILLRYCVHKLNITNTHAIRTMYRCLFKKKPIMVVTPLDQNPHSPGQTPLINSFRARVRVTSRAGGDRVRGNRPKKIDWTLSGGKMSKNLLMNDGCIP